MEFQEDRKEAVFPELRTPSRCEGSFSLSPLFRVTRLECPKWRTPQSLGERKEKRQSTEHTREID